MKARITLLFLCVSMMFSLCACSGGAVSLTELPDPTDSVEGFFEHLRNEEYGAADDLIYNYDTLGMVSSSDFDDPVMQVFYSELSARRKVKIVMEPKISGRNAVVAVQVTTLDLRSIYAPLITNVKDTIRHMQYVGEDVSQESTILSVATDELSKLLGSDAAMTTSEIFALELVYTEGIWKLIISDELYSALIGYAV